MNKTWPRSLSYAALLVALALAPWLGAYPPFLMKVLCFALFACGLNLLLGYAGLLSFGHAAFFGGAGYLAGYALRDLAVNPEICLLIGAATGAIVGLVFGLFAIRRQGIYFAMVTLAFAQMLYFACLQMPFTGGEDGLQGVPRGKLFGVFSMESDLSLYYVVLLVCTLLFLLIGRIIASPFGQVLGAIRENEPRAISLGYDVNRFKLLAFVLSATLAGIAGAMKTWVLGFETLSDVHWTMSGTVILMTLLGGLGTRFGPIVGAFAVVALESKLGSLGAQLSELTHIAWFKDLGDSVTTVTGLIFMVCVLVFRRGICGEALAWMARWDKARQPAARADVAAPRGH